MCALMVFRESTASRRHSAPLASWRPAARPDATGHRAPAAANKIPIKNTRRNGDNRVAPACLPADRWIATNSAGFHHGACRRAACADRMAGTPSLRLALTDGRSSVLRTPGGASQPMPRHARQALPPLYRLGRGANTTGRHVLVQLGVECINHASIQSEHLSPGSKYGLP